MNSSQSSSRDSSPAARSSNVPASQLPPIRANIPTSQLPPRPGISPIPPNLNTSNGHTDFTPYSSPRVSNFSTSTPVLQPNLNLVSSGDKTVQQQNYLFTSNTVSGSPSKTFTNSTPLSAVPNLVNTQNVPLNVPLSGSNFSTPPVNKPNLISQVNTLTHSSSTPTLTNLNITTQSATAIGSVIRQDLNQPQTIQRPVSSGPQLQQHVSEPQKRNVQDTVQSPQQTPNVASDTSKQMNPNPALGMPNVNHPQILHFSTNSTQGNPMQQNVASDTKNQFNQPHSNSQEIRTNPNNIMPQNQTQSVIHPQQISPFVSTAATAGKPIQQNMAPDTKNQFNQQHPNPQEVRTNPSNIMQNMGADTSRQFSPATGIKNLSPINQIMPQQKQNVVSDIKNQFNQPHPNSQEIRTNPSNMMPQSVQNMGVTGVKNMNEQQLPLNQMQQKQNVIPEASRQFNPVSSMLSINHQQASQFVPTNPALGKPMPQCPNSQDVRGQPLPPTQNMGADASRQFNPAAGINNLNTQQPQLRTNPPIGYNAPPLQQNIPPVPPGDNRVPTNNMNYSNQNVMRPPMYPNQPSTAASPLVSNVHAKRYPQPPNQNASVTTQPVNLYTQNTTATNYSSLDQPQNNANTYPQQPPAYQQQQQQYQQQNYQQRNYQQQQNVTQQMQNMNVVKGGYNKLWGHENFDLLQCPNVLPEQAIEPPKVSLGQEFLDAANCSPEIFRCTMTKIPESNSLLQKSRLPLGVLIHPFKDLNHLPVIQCNTIVRCRACRTYINPFIFFVDTKRWKCNLCYRVNELPEEFQYDPVSKSYGDPSRRPEIKSSTIEYIAPSEYMLRPPQPAVYLFLLDISRLAIESGYLHTVCEVLSSLLSSLPGDARTQIGFIAYNSTLHFFSLAEGLSQPHEMIVSDVDDIFLPCPDNLLVNLKEHMDLVSDLLAQLPNRYQNSFDGGSALGAALQAALKLMSSTGGRVTVFQTSLPMLGPGALAVREDPNQRAGKEAPHLNPATDFYKRLALDCSGHQIAVDLFILNSQYVDIATLSGISRFSGGCMYHFPLFKASRISQAENLERCFRRYITRKIGFEAVMRIRCTRGLSIHTFHGNFFVRSTDLLSLPNVNPDAGFGMQVSIEENLSDLQTVCFQAALLYTSSKGERRIRVHTLCLPVVNSLSDILNSADQQCIVGLLSKMAVDRSLQSSLSDARDAFINVAIDILSSYKLSLNMGSSAGGIFAPQSLKLLPLYILALLKYTAFRTGQSTRLDDRVFAMCDMKTLPLAQLLQNVYPDLYPIYRLAECPNVVDSEGVVIPQPRRLQLTSRNIDAYGAYLLDAGQQIIIYVCPNVSQQFLIHTLGVPNYNSISDQCYELPKLENVDNQRLHAFINSLNDEKACAATIQIIRDNAPNRMLMLERLIEDRIESALSYNEFLQHLKTQVK